MVKGFKMLSDIAVIQSHNWEQNLVHLAFGLCSFTQQKKAPFHCQNMHFVTHQSVFKELGICFVQFGADYNTIKHGTSKIY